MEVLASSMTHLTGLVEVKRLKEKMHRLGTKLDRVNEQIQKASASAQDAQGGHGQRAGALSEEQRSSLQEEHQTARDRLENLCVRSSLDLKQMESVAAATNCICLTSSVQLSVTPIVCSQLSLSPLGLLS